jgi:hypothetical protein
MMFEMQLYELVTLTTAVGTLSPPNAALTKALSNVAAFTTAPEARGALLGCWLSELGPQNKIVLLRSFDNMADLEDERQRVLLSSNPFGCSDVLTGLAMESHAQFPDLPPIVPGNAGPLYEFRTYALKIGGLSPTVAAWAKAIPARTALSPLITVMYALDGPSRFTHVWAYHSHDERRDIRAEALRIGVWPAKGAPEWLTTDMKSEIYTPTEISQLR